MDNELLLNIDKVHTTHMGIDRIKRNLKFDVTDIVKYCCDKISKVDAIIERRGKNWYVTIDSIIITINANSYTIITAHKITK